MAERNDAEQKCYEEAIEASFEGALGGRAPREDALEAAAREGRVLDGTVVGTSGDDLVVELGPRVEGVVPADEIEGEPPPPGARMKVTVQGREGDLLVLSARHARALAAWSEMEEGALVEAKVVGVNKSGLELSLGKGASGFMPASQISIGREDDLERFAGETMVAEVVEVDRERRRVVLSRRRVLEAEARRAREEGMARISIGAVLHGRVARIESYGAFVDVGGGVEGMVHVSNLSHSRVEHPSEVVKVGEPLEVVVLEISEGGRRIGLGRKQLEPDPWDEAAHRFPPDTVLTGKVRRLVDFGAFVEVAPGIEGLLHVSALGAGHVRHPKHVLAVGEELAVRVTKVDPDARRMSLSRLDPSGALLGSDEAADAESIDEVLGESGSKPIGTNLGKLFQRALKKEE